MSSINKNTSQLFTNYNKSNTSNMISTPKGVNYCIAIKKYSEYIKKTGVISFDITPVLIY